MVIAFVGLAGCQHLFDISPGGTDGGDGPTGDAPIGTVVTGTYGFTVIVNASTHMPTTSTGVYSGFTASVMLDDGTTPPVTTIGGAFQFDVEHPSQRYVVSLTVDGLTERFDSTAARLTLVDHLYGRLDRDPVLPGTELDVTFEGAPFSASVPTVYTTGLWAQTTLTAFAPGNDTFTLPWANLSSLSGPLGLLDSTKFDELFVGLIDSVGAHYALDDVATVDLDMTAGGRFPVDVSVEPLLLDDCLTVDAPLAAGLTRIESAGYGNGAALHALWHIDAQPTTDYGVGAGLQIAYEQSTTDADDTIDYAIPFPGHVPVLGTKVYADRPLTYGADTPFIAANGSEHFVLPDGSCSNPSIVPDEVGLPTKATLGGIALDTDNVSFAVDGSQPQLLEWTNTAGKADASRVDLMVVGDGGSKNTSLTPVAVYYSSTNSVLIDPASLESGVTYAVRITTLSGYPNVATGDFATVEFPFEEAYVIPGTFVAQ